MNFIKFNHISLTLIISFALQSYIICTSSSNSSTKIKEKISDLALSFVKYDMEIGRDAGSYELKNNNKINLAYFTPWNKEGEFFVKKFAKKLDIISPVWFDLKPEILQGEYNTNVSQYTLTLLTFTIKIVDI